jgi:hypothetical protein
MMANVASGDFCSYHINSKGGPGNIYISLKQYHGFHVEYFLAYKPLHMNILCHVV